MLIYVTPGCRSCDSLLQAIERWQSPQLSSRLVIVVGASLADAGWLMRRTGGAIQPGWFADPRGQLLDALGAVRAPAVLAFAAISWSGR